MLPIGEAVTPGEYSQLAPVIEAYWQREKTKQLQVGPGLGPDFSRITATRVNLGTLGEGFVVNFAHSPECGNGGCPMALLVRGPTGYRIAIMAGGWGYAVLPSSGSVPDIAFYGHISASESAAQAYRYINGQFVAQQGSACTGNSNSSPVCAGMSPYWMRVHAISPAEYDALRPVIGAGIKKQLAASGRELSFESAHATNLYRRRQAAATAVGLGECKFNANCTISIYGSDAHGHNAWPLLSSVSGWGVAGSPEDNLPGFVGLRLAFVIASHISPGEDELRRYSVALTGHFGDLNPGSHLVPDACEIVKPKAGHWPALWNPAALVAQPVSCFQEAAPEESQIPAADTTNISAAVQAGDGTVWAVGSGPVGKLYRWRNGEWIEAPSPLTGGASGEGQAEGFMANGPAAQPIGLWPGGNGGVVVLWLTPSQNSEIVWRRGGETKMLVLLPTVGQPEMPERLDVQTVAAARSGTVVIAEDDRGRYRNGVRVSGAAQGIFRVGADQHLKRIYTFTADQFLPHLPPTVTASRSPYFLPLQATRDGEGKIWIWSGSRRPVGRPEAREGFLVTDGETIKYYQQIPGLPDARVFSVTNWDSHHLAAADFQGGVYIINTTTFEAHLLPEPEPGAFRFVEKVFHAGSDNFVLTSCQPLNAAGSLPADNSGALWRWRDGHWKAVMHACDLSGVALATRDGLWLGTSDFRGLWFVPNHGAVRRVDFRQGVPLASVTELFELPGGDILATDAGKSASTRTVDYRPALLREPLRASNQFSVIYPMTNLVPDSHHNLWGLLRSGRLGEWDGSQWIRHSLPPTVYPARITGLDIDTRGRVWLFPDCSLGPMGFFDPAEKRWTAYQDYRDALTHRAHPVKFLHADLGNMRPIYGPNSQIVFIGQCRGLNYFDGRTWHQWNSWELPGPMTPGELPFFDAAGRLAIDPEPHVFQRGRELPRLGRDKPTTWEWTPNFEWRIVPYEPGPRVPFPNPFAPLPPTPASCETMPPSSLVQDATGRMWWVAGDALYEGSDGECHTILSSSSRQPFIDGRQLVRTLLDAHGNAFLQTQSPSSYVILKSSAFDDPGK